MLRGGGGWRDGKQSAFMYLSVTDQARDVMVLKQGVCEDVWRSESGGDLDCLRGSGGQNIR
jgi:hypothetical protein